MRIALRIAAAILLTAVLLFAAIIQIDQHILRRHAEQLNADLQPLMRRPATWDDLQRIQARWGRYGHYEGTCNRDHCAYRIALKGLPWRRYSNPWDEYRSWFHRAHELVGVNDTSVQADLRLTRNRLWGIAIEIYPGRYKDQYSDAEALFARLVFGPRLFSYDFSSERITVQN